MNDPDPNDREAVVFIAVLWIAALLGLWWAFA